MPGSEQSIDATQQAGLRISVIVPVYNHWDRVPDLLACLSVQTLASGSFELLLVDNGSHAPPPAGPWPDWVRLLECRTPGSYAARNHAIGLARAPLLAFTDADCRPAPAWLESLLHCLEAGGRKERVVAGRIEIEPADREHMTLYELYDVALGLPQARYVQKRGYGVTANLAASRGLVERLGRFDAQRYSGGDSDFCRRATQAGAELIYCVEAAIVHPARREWADLARKSRRIKGGQIRSGTWQRRLQYVARTLLPPVFAWRYALAAGRLTWPQRLKVCAVQARLWGVEVSELLRLLAGRARRRE